MPITPEDLAAAESRRRAQEVDHAMLILATVLLRKTGRRAVRISHDDIHAAVTAGLAEPKVDVKDSRTVTYTLPSKRKQKADAP